MTILPIVLAPGMMCDHHLFAAQVSALGENREIIHADFSKGETITEMADHLLANAPATFYLAGLSMGGIVAFEVWRKARERVAGLALMNTTALADSPARHDTRLDQIERVHQGHLKTVVMEELKPNYLGAKTKKDQDVLNDIYKMAETLGPATFTSQSKALMTREESISTLQTIACPTVILAGEEDEVCPPELHEIIHQGIAGSHYHVIAECGHLSPIEAPERVNDILQSHLHEIEKR